MDLRAVRPRRGRAEGSDIRFVVANLSKRDARGLYEDAIAGADRPKTIPSPRRRIWWRKETANQFRLFPHDGAN